MVSIPGISAGNSGSENKKMDKDDLNKESNGSFVDVTNGNEFKIVSSPVPEKFELMHRFWMASNYLAVGQIYLLDKNPLLERPLEFGDVKKRLLGHFGTTSGQNFIYVHLNRAIKERGLNMIYVSGPGHGGPAIVAQVYMEGTYTDYYPNIREDTEGLGKFFKQFSFPGGIPSHVAPETPGSIHEGGELGYSLSHSFGAVLDKPDLIIACVVGDGEAETGPLSTSWHSNKYINPRTDGAVLPILHLNGWKIANPCILARIPREELKSLFVGYGYEPIFVEGSDPASMHPKFAESLDLCLDKIKKIQKEARELPEGSKIERPVWPVIIFISPKGWTGPKVVDGHNIEGNHLSHQVPLSSPSTNKDHLKLLETWLKSYEPEKQFTPEGTLVPELKELLPPKELCMGNNPLTNPMVRPLILPDFQEYCVEVDKNARGANLASDSYTTGVFLRDVIKKNEMEKSFRIFGPDETHSNKLHAVYEETNKQWMGQIYDSDDSTAQYGRVMEMLSEHQCEGWLEGYLLTGRHGIFNSYEAFIHIISSMFNQHAKWLKVTKDIEWRHDIASLNILLASHVWRQDHNGFTHQDPSFIQHVASKKSNIVRIYLPPDANCLLSCTHHCLKSRHYVNVIVAGKHPSRQWLTAEEAHIHCSAGVGIWGWASNDRGFEPDIVMACAGDVPTLEALAATSILRQELPDLKIRFVNVVDLMRICAPEDHPHGLNHEDFDEIFTVDKPILFNFHAYPQLVEKLFFDRKNHNLLVKGYVEEGTISTAFDMTVMNGVDRFSLVADACQLIRTKCVKISEKTKSNAVYLRQEMREKLVIHRQYINENGVDLDEVNDWEWPSDM